MVVQNRLGTGLDAAVHFQNGGGAAELVNLILVDCAFVNCL